MGTNPDLTGKNDAYAVDIKNNITILQKMKQESIMV